MRELYCKLMELYINLKTVDQVDQLTKITYILDRAVTKLPEKYKEKYMEYYFERRDILWQSGISSPSSLKARSRCSSKSAQRC